MRVSLCRIRWFLGAVFVVMSVARVQASPVTFGCLGPFLNRLRPPFGKNKLPQEAYGGVPQFHSAMGLAKFLREKGFRWNAIRRVLNGPDQTGQPNPQTDNFELMFFSPRDADGRVTKQLGPSNGILVTETPNWTSAQGLPLARLIFKKKPNLRDMPSQDLVSRGPVWVGESVPDSNNPALHLQRPQELYHASRGDNGRPRPIDMSTFKKRFANQFAREYQGRIRIHETIHSSADFVNQTENSTAKQNIIPESQTLHLSFWVNTSSGPVRLPFRVEARFGFTFRRTSSVDQEPDKYLTRFESKIASPFGGSQETSFDPVPQLPRDFDVTEFLRVLSRLNWEIRQVSDLDPTVRHLAGRLIEINERLRGTGHFIPPGIPEFGLVEIREERSILDGSLGPVYYADPLTSPFLRRGDPRFFSGLDLPQTEWDDLPESVRLALIADLPTNDLINDLAYRLWHFDLPALNRLRSGGPSAKQSFSEILFFWKTIPEEIRRRTLIVLDQRHKPRRGSPPLSEFWLAGVEEVSPSE